MTRDEDVERRIQNATPGELKKELVRLFELPPSRLRDGRIAQVYLELARRTQGKERERAFLAGYSYARTSRDPEARLPAERLREEFAAWRR